jgi:hypothetical protein
MIGAACSRLSASQFSPCSRIANLYSLVLYLQIHLSTPFSSVSISLSGKMMMCCTFPAFLPLISLFMTNLILKFLLQVPEMLIHFVNTVRTTLISAHRLELGILNMPTDPQLVLELIHKLA